VPVISCFLVATSGQNHYILWTRHAVNVTGMERAQRFLLAQHLTDAVVRRLPAPKSGKRITLDDEVTGFGVRVTAAGARSYVLRYTTRAGRERTFTIGDAAVWRCTDARAKARDLRRDIEDGGDPLGDIEAEREAPTVDDLIERFEQEHLPRKRPSTADDYRRSLRLHIRPALKNLKVADVTFSDIDRLHRKITAQGSPYQANRTIALASKMFSLAIRWRMRSDNPAKGIERNTEYGRRRYLSGEELGRLVAALAKHQDRQAADIVRLLLLSGARRGEVLGMRWADVDLGKGVWSKPASSTKQREAHEVPLSAPARALLSDIAERYAREHPRRPLPEFVFPSHSSTGHIVEIKKSWRHLCRAAAVSGLRIHDLRHSYASQLVSGGASLPLIGALLGHASPSTTARYAHLAHDPQREATERVGAVVTAAGKPAPEPPVKLKRRGRS
jgi:integrase